MYVPAIWASGESVQDVCNGQSIRRKNSWQTIETLNILQEPQHLRKNALPLAE
jgi:hypothetical protein